MNFTELAQARYSVRKFRPEAVPEELIGQILQAGQLAPTACNNQPQQIFVLQSPETLAAFRECTHSHFEAPLALVVCYDRDRCWTRRYDGKSSGDIDAAIVTTHMMLKAAELGIGSTWVMSFDPEALRRVLKIPECWEPTAILVMGYAAEDAEPSPRHAETRPLADMVIKC